MEQRIDIKGSMFNGSQLGRGYNMKRCGTFRNLMGKIRGNGCGRAPKSFIKYG
jgi:hypothetical protein